MLKHIEIGGEKRPVRFSINALMEFEELTELDITSNEGRLAMTKLRSVRALAFVGLKHGAKAAKQEFNHTIEDVGDWIDTESQTKILDAFVEESSGKDDDGMEEESKKKLDGATSEP